MAKTKIVEVTAVIKLKVTDKLPPMTPQEIIDMLRVKSAHPEIKPYSIELPQEYDF